MNTSPFENMKDEGTETDGGMLTSTTSGPQGLTECEQQTNGEDKMLQGMAIGFGGGAGLFLVLLVFAKMMGFSVERKRTPITPYHLMQEDHPQSRNQEMSHLE